MSSLFVHVIERDMLAYRRQWMIFLTGFVEPLLYLLSIGVGVGALVGSVHVVVLLLFVTVGSIAGTRTFKRRLAS